MDGTTITINIYRTSEAPATVGGMVTKQGAGYTIILNANKSDAEQLATFLHEMTHIYNGDLTTGGNVGEIETRTQRAKVKNNLITPAGRARSAPKTHILTTEKT